MEKSLNFIITYGKETFCFIFSLFTKNYTVVFDYFKTHKQPSNLSIVLSSLMLNTPFEIEQCVGLKNLKIFTVYTKKYTDTHSVPINCGKNRCIDCLRCYTKNKTPVFIAEQHLYLVGINLNPAPSFPCNHTLTAHSYNQLIKEKRTLDKVRFLCYKKVNCSSFWILFDVVAFALIARRATSSFPVSRI